MARSKKTNRARSNSKAKPNVSQPASAAATPAETPKTVEKPQELPKAPVIEKLQKQEKPATVGSPMTLARKQHAAQELQAMDEEIRTLLEGHDVAVAADKDLLDVLGDGTALCSIAGVSRFHAAPQNDSQRRENISHFLAEQRARGLGDIDLFETNDLFEGRDPTHCLRVIQRFLETAPVRATSAEVEPVKTETVTAEVKKPEVKPAPVKAEAKPVATAVKPVVKPTPQPAPAKVEPTPVAKPVSKPAPAPAVVKPAAPAPVQKPEAKKVVQSAAGDAPRQHRVTFTTRYNTFFGQHVAVCGDIVELGSWDSRHAFPLTWRGDGTWEGVVPLPADTPFEYKFVAVDPAGTRWEADPLGPNRQSVAGPSAACGGAWIDEVHWR